MKNSPYDYYVSKDSLIVEKDVRSRLYGAYLANDFAVPDQGNSNNWGGFRMINWNGPKMTRGEVTDINPNNHFIIDNSRGGNTAFTSIFTAEGGGASKWFTVKYITNGERTDDNIVNNFAKIPLLDSATVNAIHVGAGIFGGNGDPQGSYEFYAKNPTLLNKTDPTLNIRGAINMTGTTEKLFAGNLGTPKGGTDREIVTGTNWLDVEGEIMISFDLVGGTGDFPPARIMDTVAETNTVSVTADSEDGGELSYQWYRNTQNTNSGGTAISGATGPSFPLSTT
jgi:hypothetical protein